MKKIYALLFTCVCFVSATFSQTAFTPGNLVVLRIGDGSGALTSAATPVFLDEYSTITGQVVQSVAMPTAVSGNNRRLTLSGTATSEGGLTLSPNGQFLCLAGHDTTVGAASVANASNMGKTIALVNASGSVNTSTGIERGSAFNGSGGNIRSAVTNDGTGVWASGAGSSSSGGTYYLPSGAISTPVKVSASPTNNRILNIFGGQLYTSAASAGFYGVSEVGTGLPTTSGQTTTILPGFPGATTGSSSYAYAMFDLDATEAGVDVIYVADDNINATGGIVKYSKVGGTWVQNSNLSSSKALRGLTLINSCGKIRGFVSSQDSIYSFVDNAGYNQNINATLTSLIGKSTNTVFRGIAFAPGTVAPTAPTASATNVSDAKCFGTATGEATINVTGGAGTLTYSWSDNGTGATRTNLAKGVYSVTISDQLACTAVVDSIEILEPTALTVTNTKVNVSCFGLSDGSLTPSVSGGTSTYQYAWSSGNGSNLAADTYTLTVTDSKGCTVVKRDTVTQPALLTISAAKGDVTCGSTNNGFINTTTAGGNGGNTYLWEDAVTITNNRSGLTAGAYAVTVTDSKGCTAARKDTINQSSDLNVAGLDTNVRCYGTSTGAINITATGGTNVYTYNWGNGITDEDRTNLGVGTYSVTVSDNGGCTGTASFTLTQPDSLSATAVVTNVSCNGAADGVIDVTPSGGVGPYSLEWSLGGPVTEDLDSLSGGSYSFTTTDGNGCTYNGVYFVIEPDSLGITGFVTNVTSFGATNGAINVTVAGGTPNYDFDWGNNVTTQNRSNIGAGVYTVTVTDDKGCTKVKSFTVSQPSSLEEVGEFIWIQNLGIESGYLNFAIKTERTGDVNITLVSANGQVIQKQTIQNVSNQVVALDASAIASGVYIVRFDVAGESIAKRVAIVK